MPKGEWFGTLARYKSVLPVLTRGWMLDGDGCQLDQLSAEMLEARDALANLNYGALNQQGYSRTYLWNES